MPATRTIPPGSRQTQKSDVRGTRGGSAEEFPFGMTLLQHDEMPLSSSFQRKPESRV